MYYMMSQMFHTRFYTLTKACLYKTIQVNEITFSQKVLIFKIYFAPLRSDFDVDHCECNQINTWKKQSVVMFKIFIDGVN